MGVSRESNLGIFNIPMDIGEFCKALERRFSRRGNILTSTELFLLIKKLGGNPSQRALNMQIELQISEELKIKIANGDTIDLLDKLEKLENAMLNPKV